MGVTLVAVGEKALFFETLYINCSIWYNIRPLALIFFVKVTLGRNNAGFIEASILMLRSVLKGTTQQCYSAIDENEIGRERYDGIFTPPYFKVIKSTEKSQKKHKGY